MLSSRPIHANPDISLREGWATKTPGRALKGGRENVIHAGAMTLGAKPKPSRTPFHGGALQKHELVKDGGSSQNVPMKPTITVARAPIRPLGDKTPFPNRVGGQYNTPLPQALKFPNLLLLDPESTNPESDTVQRPSTTRKHVRVPRSASKSFETPMNNGNHWDVSEGSIVLAEAVAQEAVPEDDCDEIEYLAPNTLNLPYTPPFDFELPDYKIVGKTLLSLAHSCPYDDLPLPELSVGPQDVEFVSWKMFEIPAVESDDPFHQAKMEQQAAKTRADSKLKAGHVTRAASAASTSMSATIRPRLPRAGVPASSLAPNKSSKPLTQKIGGTIPAPRSMARNESLHTTGSRHITQKALVNTNKTTTTTFSRQRPGTALANPRVEKTVPTRTLARPTTSASVYRNHKPSPPVLAGTKIRRLGAIKNDVVKSDPSTNDKDALNLFGLAQVELEDFRFDI